MRTFEVTVRNVAGEEIKGEMEALHRGELWNRVRNALKQGYKLVSIKEIV